MVLSAGFGTRLLPLTTEVPKPLLPVGSAPLLSQHLQALAQLGARPLVVNVHHLGGEIANEIRHLSLNVQVIVEAKILGTAGGIAGARNRLNEQERTIVVNGDIFGPLPVRPLLEAAPADLVLAVVPRPLGQGTVGLGARGDVVRLRGECFGTECASGDYMGVARLSRAGIQSLPIEGCLVGDWALPMLRAGGRVGTVSVVDEFIDIGTTRDYVRANLAWLRERGLAQFVAGDAVVAPGVAVDDSVVCAGAVVSGAGALSRCVVLGGAQATAPLADAVVMPSGKVVEVL